MELRSVLVDGSPLARVGGYVSTIAPLADGRSAWVLASDLSSRSPQAWTVWRWNLDDGVLTRVLSGADAGMPITALSPDGGRMFRVTPERVLRIDTVTAGGVTSRVANNLRMGVGVPVTSPDGRFVVLGISTTLVSDGRRVTLAEVDTERTIELSTMAPAAFSGDGRHAAWVDARSGDLQCCTLADLTVRGCSLKRPPSRESRVVTDGDGLALLTPGAYTAIDRDGPRLGRTISLPARRHVIDVARGRILLRGVERGAVVYECFEAATGARRTLDMVDGLKPVLTPDGRFALWQSPPLLEMCDLDTGRRITRSDGADAAVRALCWSRDGALLATLSDLGTVRVWDVAPPSLRWVFERAGRWGALAFSPDARTLHGLFVRALTTWDLSTGLEVRSVPKAGQRASSMACSPDGRLLFAAHPGMDARLLDLDLDGARAASFTFRGGAPHTSFDGDTAMLCFEPAASTLQTQRCTDRSTATPGEARAFDVTLPNTWWGETGSFAYAHLDGCPGAVLVHDDTSLRRADLREGTQRTLATTPPTAALLAATDTRALLRDGNALTLWDLDAGCELARTTPARPVRHAQLSPDGTRAAVVFTDGGVEVFALP